MYKFIGYMIKDAAGEIVRYTKTRGEADELCRDNSIPESCITQIFEHFIDVDDIDTVEKITLS